MNCFFEDAGYLLRQCAMFGCSTALQRFLEVVRNVCTDKNSFAISHLTSPSLALSGFKTLQSWNRSVSRILYFDQLEVAIIHLAQPLPVGSSDLPGGRSR